MTLQKDVLHGGISKLWQNDGMVYKDFALVTGYGYGVFFYTPGVKYIGVRQSKPQNMATDNMNNNKMMWPENLK